MNKYDDIILMISDLEKNCYDSDKYSDEEIYSKCLKLRLPKLKKNEYFKIKDSYRVDDKQVFILSIDDLSMNKNDVLDEFTNNISLNQN